jgi:hypothetical protein
MKKLKLDLADLRVESFETTHDAAAAEGTVFGQSFFTFEYTMCGGNPSCDAGCSETTLCSGGTTTGGTSEGCSAIQTNCANVCQD